MGSGCVLNVWGWARGFQTGEGFEQPGKGRTFKIEVLWEVHLGTSRCGKCDKKVRLFCKHF